MKITQVKSLQSYKTCTKKKLTFKASTAAQFLHSVCVKYFTAGVTVKLNILTAGVSVKLKMLQLTKEAYMTMK